MKKFLLLFVIWFNENKIAEDWDSWTIFGKIYIYPFWIMRSIIYWIISPIFIPEFMFKQSTLYTVIINGLN